MKTLIITLFFSTIISFSTSAQLTMSYLKNVSFDKTFGWNRNEFNRVIKLKEEILCSDKNLLGVKEIGYSNASFDFWGNANSVELFFIKDSLINIEIEFLHDIQDTANFRKFLKIAYSQMKQDPEVREFEKKTFDAGKLIQLMYKENNKNKSVVPKTYYNNLYEIIGSENYFQTFISISKSNENPLFRFVFRLDNFNMNRLETYYKKEIGSLPLSNNCQ